MQVLRRAVAFAWPLLLAILAVVLIMVVLPAILAAAA